MLASGIEESLRYKRSGRQGAETNDCFDETNLLAAGQLRAEKGDGLRTNIGLVPLLAI